MTGMFSRRMRFTSLAVLIFALAVPCLAADGVKKVSTVAAMSAVVTKENPEYPPLARQLKVEGTVQIGVVIDEAGKVEKTEIVSGNPMLTQPTANAVKHWKFKPFQEDGRAVKAEATLSITFKL
jgi:protein TonB